MRKAYFFTIIILLVSLAVAAQGVIRYDVTVLRDGDPLDLAFAGGLDAPQLSQADLNRDGIQDLFIFDRVGYVSIPLVYDGPDGSMNYHVDWDLLEGFPTVPLWALLRDFNGDGVEDMFASTLHPGIQGIDVYRGNEDDGKLSFERMTFDLGQFDLLYVEVSNIFTPMYSAWGDIPAIDDIDGDGDLDILSFEPGGAYMHYFRNNALEEGLGKDTLLFEWEDICWGKFIENGFNQQVKLSPSSSDCATNNDPFIQLRHSGSASFTHDLDLDGDKDLLLGDLASPNITYLINGGTAENAHMTSQIVQFPPDVPVDLEFFVSPYIMDLNHDGLVDFLATSNNDNFSENHDVIWYYENTGTPDEFDFSSLIRKDLFVSEMIDYGSIAKPAIGDFNGDGLPDILFGTGGFFDNGSRDARLILMVNIGTADIPVFDIVDDDYLSFSQFNSVPTWDFAPCTGDIDNDGDMDLLVGERNGGLFFVENIAGADSPPEFAAPDYPYSDINVGAYSTPTVVDLNGDGLTDIVVGERLGNNDDEGRCSNLNYFQNIGMPGAADFDPDLEAPENTQCLGRIIFNTSPGLTEFSSPDFVMTPEGLKMLSGSEQGPIRMYSGIEGNTTGAFTLEDTLYGNIRDGFRSVPALGDLNNDGLYNLVVGNFRGGLTLYETDLEVLSTSADSPGTEVNNLVIYPNPASDMIHLAGENSYRLPSRLEFVDVLGRTFAVSLNHRRADIGHLPSGMYLVRGTIDGKMYFSRVMVTR